MSEYIMDRNVIFFHPLIKTLLELKEDFEKLENYNVFEVDSISEFAQLIDAVEQTIVFSSDINKTQKALETYEKKIKRKEIKIMLMSPKKVPPMAFIQMQKKGLHESIPDTLSKKAITFKIDFIYRTFEAKLKNLELKRQKEEQDLLKLQRLKEKKAERAKIDTLEKLQVEKGMEGDEPEKLGGNLTGKIKGGNGDDDKGMMNDLSDYEMDMEGDAGGHLRANLKKNQAGDESGHMQADINSEDEDEESFYKKKNSKYTEEDEESYYKKKKVNQEEVEVDYGERKKSNYKEEESGNLTGRLNGQEEEEEHEGKKGFMDVESELNRKKYDDPYADIEEEKKKHNGSLFSQYEDFSHKNVDIDFHGEDAERKRGNINWQGPEDEKDRTRLDEVDSEYDRKRARLEDVDPLEKERKRLEEVELDLEKKRAPRLDDLEEEKKPRTRLEEVAPEKKERKRLEEFDLLHEKRPKVVFTTADYRKKKFVPLDEEALRKGKRGFMDAEGEEGDNHGQHNEHLDRYMRNNVAAEYGESGWNNKKAANWGGPIDPDMFREPRIQGHWGRTVEDPEDQRTKTKKEDEENVIDMAIARRQKERGEAPPVEIDPNAPFEYIEEEVDPEMEFSTYYPPDAQVLVYFSYLTNFYMDKEIPAEKICQFIQFILLKTRNGLVSFYRASNNQIRDEIFSGHAKKEGHFEWLPGSWQLILNEWGASWAAIKTPWWSDHTWQESCQTFVYPFYDGDVQLGVVIANFEGTINSDDDAKQIETLIIGARGIFFKK